MSICSLRCASGNYLTACSAGCVCERLFKCKCWGPALHHLGHNYDKGS